MKIKKFVIAIALTLFFFTGTAIAQNNNVLITLTQGQEADIFCSGGELSFVPEVDGNNGSALCLVVLPTVTPIPPTASQLPPTVTPLPATATSVPATATGTPTSVSTATTGVTLPLTVNVPVVDVPSGSVDTDTNPWNLTPRDANNWAIITVGEIDGENTDYGQARFAFFPEGLRAYVQVLD